MKKCITFMFILSLTLIAYTEYRISTNTRSIRAVVGQLVNASMQDQGYAERVLDVAFHEMKDEQEMRDVVDIWWKDKWGAQIGALRIICERNPDVLLKSMTADTQKTLCRTAKGGNIGN